MKKLIYGIGFVLICVFLFDYYIFVKYNNQIESNDESGNKIEINRDSIDKRVDESWKNYGK